MQHFVGSFTNKIDKKGRVSVPATFRTVLAASSFSGFVGIPSFEVDAIEALTVERFDRIVREIDMLDPYSEERQDLMQAFASDSHHVSFDSEGRIAVPVPLIEAAGIDGEVKFVGKATHFELWNPADHDAHIAQTRQRIREKKLSLPSWGRAGAATGPAQSGGRDD